MACHMVLVVTLVLVPFINCAKLITILSDFTSDKDVEFFKNTFPWVVDNAASNIKFNFYFKDSGKNSGQRQCVLAQLVNNPYLQADYLKCEAKGDEECIKILPLNTRHLSSCIRLKVKGFVTKADREFQKYRVEVTPVVILPKRQIITDLTPKNILKTICALHGRKQPLGCIKPIPMPEENDEKKTNPENTPEKEENSNPEKIPKTEETPNREGIPKVEESPNVEGTPKVEESPNPERTPKFEESPNPEGLPEVEVEESPNLEGTPKVEEGPKSEGTPKVEESPNPEENLEVEETPNREGTSDVEENPNPKENPEVEETPNREGTPDVEESPNPEGPPEVEEIPEDQSNSEVSHGSGEPGKK